jgi:outer membrane lipoprotein carrier protein
MLLSWLVSAVLLASLASAKQVKELVARLETTYRSARTLQATFLERYTENAKEVRSEAGTAYFRRPGKMRWEYERPDKDLFLVDGKTAWFYVPADHTVTRVPAKESTDLRTPLALLAGETKVSRVCARVRLEEQERPQQSDNALLRCELRGAKGSAPEETSASAITDADPNSVVFFEIVPGTGELARLIVQQPGGVRVEFKFENWRINPPLPDSMFRFQAPVGVAIVNGELPQEDAPEK